MKKFLFAQVALILCILSLTGCLKYYGEKPTGTGKMMFGYHPRDEFLSAYDNTEYQSFANLKIKHFEAGRFTARNDETYMILKCEVVEDYYGIIQPKETVTVAMRIDYGVDSYAQKLFIPTEEVYSAFFDGYLLAYISRSSNLKLTSRIDFENYPKEDIYVCSLIDYEAFPINNGGLDISIVDAMLEDRVVEKKRESYEEFDTYFRHRMTEDVFSESVRSLDGAIEKDCLKQFGRTNKFSTEILKIEESSDDIVVVSDVRTDVYMERITFTVKNNSKRAFILKSVNSTCYPHGKDTTANSRIGIDSVLTNSGTWDTLTVEAGEEMEVILDAYAESGLSSTGIYKITVSFIPRDNLYLKTRDIYLALDVTGWQNIGE